MEDNFNQNDFEEFLKEQVRNHRMYPADTVWRDINKKLHGDNKWPALTIAAFTLLSATIAICIHFKPKPDLFAVKPPNELKNVTPQNTPPNSNVLNNLPSSASLYKENNNFPIVERGQSGEDAAVLSDIAGVNYDKSYKLNKPATATGIKNKKPKADKINETGNLPVVNPLEKIPGAHTVLLPRAENKDAEYQSSLPRLLPRTNEMITAFKETNPSTEIPQAVKEYNDQDMVDEFLKDHKNDLALHTISKPKTLKNKFGFQIYIAPSISYRKLLEDPSMLKEDANTGPVGLNYVADVNKVVRHKPGNGIEAGVSLMYNVSNNFRLKSGVQFNVRQYSIEAYRSGTELATIALVGEHGIDTVNTVAVYRNSNGYYSTELVNRYYQVAIPIGVEWEIIGNQKIQLSVAGSIQPTYLINHNAYLLSTNFKNYSENPEMVRSFNLNSNIETFVSFKFGDYKWQLGPQLRYQPYSTFIRQYPIKEHLMDYGIKLGFSKTFR